MSSISFFFLYVVGVFIVAFLVTFVMLRRNLKKQGTISRSLNLELIAVRFPPIPSPSQEPTMQQIREKIALMEQLYANLALIRDNWFNTFFYGKPVFTLELAIPHIGEELTFYVAVPRRFLKAVEKVIQGIFSDAFIEESRDYNIFNPEGVAVGSSVAFARNLYYPVRSYQKLEGDPVKALTNVFTKIAKVGEGAALQIVARSASGKWQALLRKHAKLLFQGKRPRVGAAEKTIGVLQEVTRKPLTEQERLQQQQLSKMLTPLEEETVRGLEAKSGKALFETNIRLLVSANDRARAEEILQGLELAFAQFNDPNNNSFVVERVGEEKSLKKLTFDFSFRNFDAKKFMVLSTEEMTSVFHFPNVALQTPGIKGIKAREAAAPPNLPQQGLLLGYNVFRGEKKDINFLDEDRRRHLYIIGQTGTGKTTFMKNIIRQDIEAGKGICYIDPHGQDIQDILGMIPRERFEEVIYFDPGDIERPMGLNMLEYDPKFPEQKTLIVDELFGIFRKLYGAVPEAMGPAFEQYFRNATMLVMEDPASGNTLLEVARIFSDKNLRDLKISRSRNIVVNRFWKDIAEKTTGEQSLQNFAQYVTSKFDIFLANEIMRPIMVQEKSAFNFREVMDSGKILLINLSKGRLGDINSSLIGLIAVGKLLIAALSRVDLQEEERKDFYLYIDEFQNVTTDSIATILSEARKYRLNLTIAHQFIGQLKEEIKKAVFGNVGSMATFRIGSDDAEFMAKQYKPVFAEQDLLNIDNFNCYLKLLVNGQTVTPFSMKVYSPEKGAREQVSLIKEMSRTKYGCPREEVEQEIVERQEKTLF